jgi:O-antigen/teichoic acid export membrane protein
MNSTKVLIKNLFSLSVAEFLSRGIQFFYYIYLIRIIKPEGNGINEFSRSLAQYFLILVTLGFDQVGIREGARDKSKIKVYADTIIAIRLSIAVACYILLFFLAIFLKYNGTISSEEEIAIFIHGSILFSIAIQPQWVFQAIEKMEIIALRMTIVNALNFIGIILFVQTRSDLLLAISILMISQFLTSVWIFAHYSKHYGIPKPSLDFGFWKLIIRQAFTIGIIFMIVTAYNNLDITMLRLLLPRRCSKRTNRYIRRGAQTRPVAVNTCSRFANRFFPEAVKSRNKRRKVCNCKTFCISPFVYWHPCRFFLVFVFGFHRIDFRRRLRQIGQFA